MVIMCGVDRSEQARHAAIAAAAIAKRARQSVQLVHVQESPSLETPTGPDGAVLTPAAQQGLLGMDRDYLRADLEPLRDRLAQRFGVEVGLRFELGYPEREIARCAEEQDASLIVVGAVGGRSGPMLRTGDIPGRLSQMAPVPLLAVRDSERFSRWALGELPLRMVIAHDGRPCSARAAEIAAELGRLGPCELLEAHVYDPRHEAERLGLARPDDLDTRLAIEQNLEREMREHSDHTLGARARFVARAVHGSVAETLADLLEEERPDLVVVGARRRGPFGRRFLDPVAYGVLGLSDLSVLVARDGEVAREAVAPHIPVTVKRILAATDFSESGNRAVEHAFALLPPGGRVTLLHVLLQPMFIPFPAPGPNAGSDQRRMNRALAEAELRKLVPPGKAAETAVEAIESINVTQAILQAAERHAADLVVLGGNGRRGFDALLLGSCARAVARRCPRPVMLVPEVEHV